MVRPVRVVGLGGSLRAASTSLTALPSGLTDSCIAQDWQRSALRTIFTEAATPIPSSAVYLGFISLAVDDAVRTARGRRHISAATAVAVAAHDILVAYFPTSAGNLSADRSLRAPRE